MGILQLIVNATFGMAVRVAAKCFDMALITVLCEKNCFAGLEHLVAYLSLPVKPKSSVQNGDRPGIGRK